MTSDHRPVLWRYLSPEPLLQSPTYVRLMAQSGLSVPTYAYAANNPLRYVDRNGLDPGVPYPDLDMAAADARRYTYAKHSPDALLHEWGGTFYKRDDGRVEYSEPETTGERNRCVTGSFRQPKSGLTPIGDFHLHPTSYAWAPQDLTGYQVKRDFWNQPQWDGFVFTPSPELTYRYTATPRPVMEAVSYFVPGWQQW